LVDWRREAVSQLLWSDKDREVWFFLEKNHEKVYRFGLHQLRNCFGGQGAQCRQARLAGAVVSTQIPSDPEHETMGISSSVTESRY
jgi:hypothetical protein